MNINIKDEIFTLQAEGTPEFISSITQTALYFKGVTDWKEPNHLNEISQPVIIKSIPDDLKETLDQSPRNHKKHVVLTKKHCSKCNTTRPVKDFNKSKKDRTGYQSYCRECSNKNRTKYNHKKQEKPTKEKSHDKAPDNTALFLNWLNSLQKEVFDISEFIAEQPEIPVNKVEEIIAHQITKNKLLQLSDSKFKFCKKS